MEHEADELTSDPDAMLLLIGGFVYFDKSKSVLQINATVPNPTGGLKFGPPRRWEPEWTMQLRQQGKRWHQVTLRKLLVAGAVEFCWLRPNEFVAGVPEAGGGQYGAFVYLSSLSTDSMLGGSMPVSRTLSAQRRMSCPPSMGEHPSSREEAA